MKPFIQDNLIFTNEENPKEKVIVNFYSWVRLVEGIIVHYCHKSPEEARALVESSAVYQRGVQSYIGAGMISHEHEYNWALFINYSNNYWEHGISSDVPTDFYDWYNQFILENHLAEDTFDYYTEDEEDS